MVTSKIDPAESLTLLFLEGQLMKLLIRVDELEKENLRLKTDRDKKEKDESDTWATRLKRGSGAPTTQQVQMVNVMMSEKDEREKRSKQVIVTGVEESSGEGTERENRDIEKVKTLLNQIDVKINPKRVTRLSKRTRNGKTEETGRILVILGDTAERNLVLQSAKKLKDNQGKKVFINADMTFAESQLDYQLRVERNRLNKEINDEGTPQPFRWGIRSNKVVKIGKNSGRVLQEAAKSSTGST